MTELPKNIENQIEEIWMNSQRKLFSEKGKELENLLAGDCNIDEVVSKTEDLNSIINEICGQDEELYDMYRYRMFVKDSEVVILVRPKVVSEKDHMFLVGGNLYNLCDHNEIDVDVRRYGE